jgi:hypothetical protein
MWVYEDLGIRSLSVLENTVIDAHDLDLDLRASSLDARCSCSSFVCFPTNWLGLLARSMCRQSTFRSPVLNAIDAIPLNPNTNIIVVANNHVNTRREYQEKAKSLHNSPSSGSTSSLLHTAPPLRPQILRPRLSMLQIPHRRPQSLITLSPRTSQICRPRSRNTQTFWRGGRC